MTEERGSLVLMSGPSGVGKTSVSDRLLEEPGVVRAITATTRSPREGEVDGVDYFFLTEEKFREDVAAGRFLEWAEVHGRRYGTPKAPLEAQLERGHTVLLVIDVQGAQELMAQGIPALYLFLEPPSLEELRRRLSGRGSEDPEAFELRMKNALEELAQKNSFDHSIVNDDLDRAIEEILARIQAAKETT